MTRGTTAWVVSGALGLASFAGGVVISQGGGAVAAEPRPAVTVPAATPGATVSPTATSTVRPSTAPPSNGPTDTATAPSPVSPPSAETAD